MLEVNIDKEVLILVDKLTLDDIKAKYSWLLNAKFKDAIIGHRNNRIIWYSGEWIDGEWIDGDWYSGIWRKGIWEKGNWFSYKINIPLLLTGNYKNDVIFENSLDENSIFYFGEWWDGTFNSGIFGNSDDITWENQNSSNTIWKNGTFKSGIFRNSLWKKGTCEYGEFYNSWWLNGIFTNGKFNKGVWENGTFNGGDFIEGVWENGTFNQISNSIASRFGVYTEDLDTNDNKCIWKNGTFNKGEFYSGLFLDDDGEVIPSKNDKISKWENGIFNYGYWFGGHFENGIKNGGQWYGGIFGTWSSDWIEPKYISTDSINLFSGTTENISDVNLINISGYADFDNFYDANTLSNLDNIEFSGTTYNNSENKIYEDGQYSYTNLDPFYFYTNYEDIATGLTSYICNDDFSDGLNFWYIGNTTPITASISVVSESLEYISNDPLLSNNEYTIITQKDISCPKNFDFTFEIDIDFWFSTDSNDSLYLRLTDKYNNENDIFISEYVSGNTIQFSANTSEEIVEFSLIYKKSTLSNVVNLVINYFKTEELIPYLEAFDDEPFVGVKYMEGRSSMFSHLEGDVHELHIKIESLENIDLTIRLMDELGNIANVYNESGNTKDTSFHINETGATSLIFSENNSFFSNYGNEAKNIFLNFTSERLEFNKPFYMKISCHVITYRKSRLESNSSNELIYTGDKYRIRLNDINFINNNTENISANNVLKLFFTDSNDEIISNVESVKIPTTGTTSNSEIVELISNNARDDFKLNLEIYRDDTEYYYTNFDVESRIKVERIIENISWIDLNNLNDGNDDTYTYYQDQTGRNLVDALILSGFTFNIPNGVDLKGFKIQMIRSGFFESDDLAYVKDNVMYVDFQPYRKIIDSNRNKNNPESFSYPKAFRKELIEYGQYEDFFGYDQIQWSVDKVNNNFKIIYQPKSFKSIRLSDKIKIEGRIYSLKVRCFYQTKPIWNGGIWYNGLWINGEFNSGKIINGTFVNSTISNTIFNSNFEN
jgi:hypothetical protein